MVDTEGDLTRRNAASSENAGRGVVLLGNRALGPHRAGSILGKFPVTTSAREATRAIYTDAELLRAQCPTAIIRMLLKRNCSDV